MEKGRFINMDASGLMPTLRHLSIWTLNRNSWSAYDSWNFNYCKYLHLEYCRCCRLLLEAIYPGSPKQRSRDTLACSQQFYSRLVLSPLVVCCRQLLVAWLIQFHNICKNSAISSVTLEETMILQLKELGCSRSKIVIPKLSPSEDLRYTSIADL